MRKGWAETTLSEIAEVNMGQSPPGSSYNSDGIGLPFMQGSAEFGEHNPTPVKWCSLPAKIAEVGDLLISVRAPVGDTNIANQRIAIGRGLATIRGGKESITEFLRLLVQKNTAELIANSGTGMFSSITGKNLKEFKVLMPPLGEQKRIVDLVSSVDAYIDALQQQADSARAARNAVLHELLTAGGDDWAETTLDELVNAGVVTLGRGNVISKRDMEADPGPYPVYSSAQNNDGRIGTYNKYMFDEELITWSVDGGGYVFYRPHHRFSVTNIGGYLRIMDSTKFLYPFLAAALQQQHGQHVFDWQNKAHPSVIRKLYNSIPLVPIEEQRRIVDVVSSMDKVIQSTEKAVIDTKALRSGLLSDLLSGNHEIPASYDSLLGAA